MFVVLALPLLVLDGFDQHFQDTVHISKQRRRLAHQHQISIFRNSEKTLGMLGIEPRLDVREAWPLPLCSPKL